MPFPICLFNRFCFHTQKIFKVCSPRNGNGAGGPPKSNFFISLKLFSSMENAVSYLHLKLIVFPYTSKNFQSLLLPPHLTGGPPNSKFFLCIELFQCNQNVVSILHYLEILFHTSGWICMRSAKQAYCESNSLNISYLAIIMR